MKRLFFILILSVSLFVPAFAKGHCKHDICHNEFYATAGVPTIMNYLSDELHFYDIYGRDMYGSNRALDGVGYTVGYNFYPCEYIALGAYMGMDNVNGYNYLVLAPKATLLLGPSFLKIYGSVSAGAELHRGDYRPVFNSDAGIKLDLTYITWFVEWDIPVTPVVRTGVSIKF